MSAMRIISTLFAVFSFGFYAFVAEIHADTHTAASCSYSDVSSAIAAASPEDTVYVPAGTCSWSSTLSITKGINLIGAGKNNLTITVSGNPGVWFRPAVGAADTPFRLSGFRFNGSGSTTIMKWGNPSNQPTTLSDGNHNKFTQMRVDNNIFYSTAGVLIYLAGTGYHGVIDNNELYTNAYAMRSVNDGQIGANNWLYWPYYPGMEAVTELGHGDSVFIEDNIIESTGWLNLISSQGGHKYVVRYNDVRVQGDSFAMIDAHGNDPCCFASTLGSLIYGNDVDASPSVSGYMHNHRGGQSMVFGNTWNSSGSIQNNVYQLAAHTAGPGPATHAVTGQPQHQWKSYYFNNKKNYTSSSWQQANVGATPGGHPVRNADFWDEYDWVEASAGVGCGYSLPTGSCTEGVGFWLTDQTGFCSDITNYVGVDPATPIDGTLYICNDSNTWVEYYTPYTYPHPLRFLGPAAPKNLHIIDIK